MPIVDQFSDPAYGVLVKQASRMPAFAAFVKEAEIDSREGPELPRTAFAWPESRKFPIHSEKHAAVSYAYSLDQDLPAPVRARLDEALEAYGVPKAIFEVAGVKEATAPPPDYLLPDDKLFPLRTREEVKTAEVRFLLEFAKLRLDERATAAGNLVKRAAELEVSLHPATLQFAGLVVSSSKFACDWLLARAGAAKDESHKAAFAKLARELRTRGPEISDRASLVKVASVIAELDEKAGLVQHYDRKLPDPLRTVFNTTKEANSSVDLNGTRVPISKLSALPPAFWEDLGGPELSREIAPGGQIDPAKLATVVETLPLDLKLVLRAQLRA